MSSKAERDKQKQIQDRCQALLTDMLRDDDNKYCVDCDAKGPRWASWNLGIFLCIRCAGIHRNLGVHISKVKSVNLDTWTPEQVVSLQQMGNSRARAVYEANLPDNFRRPQTDSSLEGFIRAKYEQKKYIAREWVPPPIPKVNWDKELDEEAERQRRRKKEAKQQQIRGSVVTSLPEATVPQLLPKPKASGSPKPPREAKPAPKSATQDLLGLDAPASGPTSGAAAAANGDDIFTSFLSAPPVPSNGDPASPGTTQKAEEVGKGRSAEEESFFNQPAPSAQEKRQLTKDSILALYSTNPAPVSQPVFGIPGGMYAAPQGGYPQPTQAPVGFPVPSGMMPSQPMLPGVIQNGVYGGGGLMGQQPAAVASNPFFSMVPTTAAATFHTMTQENSSENPNQDLMLDFGAVIKNTQSARTAQLPQQFARLNMSGPQQGMMGVGVMPPPAMGVPMPTQPVVMGSFQQAPAAGHTLATNLWQ